MILLRPSRRRLAALVGATCAVVALTGVASASAALNPFYSTSGSVSLSQTGYANDSGPVTKPIVKPSAGATVQKAFLFAAGVPGYTPTNTDITLDGQPVVFTDTPVTASFGAVSREADVTSMVKPTIDAAPPGDVNLTVAEDPTTTTSIDGEIVVVIFNDPTVVNNTVALEYGTQDTTGDTFHVGFAQPIDLSKASIQFAIGDSYSLQNGGSDQYSLIDVNGTPPDPNNPAAGPDPARLTTSAGGEDDATPPCDENGCLLTVGGAGDSPANPTDPFAIPSTCEASPASRCDDELYTLGAPYVHNGDTSMSVYTLNPSNDDNILYASFVFSGINAVVGEGVTLAPPSQTDTVGSNATLTAHAQDASGNSLLGTTVAFKITSGPNAGTTGTATTDSSGNATFDYTSMNAGSDTVQASFMDNQGNTQTSNPASVVWQAPTARNTGQPSVTTAPQVVTSSTAARVAESVLDNGLPTTVHFEYGLDPKYGAGGPFDHSTPDQSVGSDFSPHLVTANLTNLVPNALYHVRLVANNSAGTTVGPDVTFMTAKSAPPGSPSLGQSFNVKPVSGVVLIELNGQFVPLTQLRQIPQNTPIDALHGTLQLTSAAPGGGSRGAHDAAANSKKHKGKTKTQTGTFGGAIFKVNQLSGGPNRGLTTLTLVESAFKGAPTYATCKAHKAADASAAALSSRTLQLLKASAHGKFSTRGRYAAATVRGTKWTTADRCNGTLIRDITDSVAVTDFAHHKTIILHAGQSYLAKPRR